MFLWFGELGKKVLVHPHVCAQTQTQRGELSLSLGIAIALVQNSEKMGKEARLQKGEELRDLKRWVLGLPGLMSPAIWP